MLIFVAIALASFILISAGFLFGHDHDSDHDHGLDHSDGGTDHTVSIFSLKVLGTFGLGFGSAGAIAAHYGAGTVGASGTGAAAGLAIGGAMWGFLSLISLQQASSLVATSELVGCDGVVTVPIGAAATGEVSVSRGNTESTFLARSQSGAALEKGQSVRVVNTSGSMVFVEPK